ncbi:hypothetical protein ACFLYV_05215 [Chloroflexota bacterium]
MAPVCLHHWNIEEPDGPVSVGVCKLCGATRHFSNTMPEFMPRPAGHQSPGLRQADVLDSSMT